MKRVSQAALQLLKHIPDAPVLVQALPMPAGVSLRSKGGLIASLRRHGYVSLSGKSRSRHSARIERTPRGLAALEALCDV